MALQRDGSAIGTVVGVVFVLVALVGTTFLGWEWGGSFAEQPAAIIVGVVAAVFAVIAMLRR